jgi:RNA polymerase sigma-70 factor (ECF subfamily)
MFNKGRDLFGLDGAALGSVSRCDLSASRFCKQLRVTVDDGWSTYAGWEATMSQEQEITDLMERAKAGDEAATREFLARFEHEVRNIVRGRLPRQLRTQFDSMDFVQAVWQSFFSRLRDQPRDFENVRHLRSFLAGVARNKIYAEHRRLTRTVKRELAREERLYLTRGEREFERPLISPEPTPSQTLQASDRLAQLITGCNPSEVQVITLRHQGLTFDEIAKRTRISERSVRRIIDEARSRMETRR